MLHGAPREWRCCPLHKFATCADDAPGDAPRQEVLATSAPDPLRLSV